MHTITTGPWYVSWNYTYACNFNCSHCYSRAESYPAELTTEEYGRIVDEYIAAKVFKVGLGGGEPLIRPDCIPIVTRMAAAGIDANITTNGWFVDDTVAGKLADAGLGRLYVSLDSPHEALHDRFRNRVGSYKRVLRAVRAATARRLKVYFSTVVTALNVDDLPALVDLARDLGVTGIEFKRFRPSGNGVVSRGHCELNAAQEAWLLAEVARLKATEHALDIALIYGAEGGDGIDAGCPCGKKSICIRPNGDVSPCAYGETVIGNLMRQRLTDLWRDSPELKLMRTSGGCAALVEHAAPSNPYLVLSVAELKAGACASPPA